MGLFVVFFFAAVALIVDVGDPIRIYFSKLKNKKTTRPLVSSGLLVNEDEFHMLEWFLYQQGRSLEDFVANGLSLTELKLIDQRLSSKSSQLWRTYEELDDVKARNTDKEREKELAATIESLRVECDELEQRMWGSFVRKTPFYGLHEN